jgi:hypothetical protein
MAAEPAAISAGADAVSQRQAAIGKLMVFLDDGSVFKDKQVDAARAIELLGELRATEAIPLLLEHLDFLPGGLPFRVPPPRQFPSVLALTRIGSPALDSLVKLTAADESICWLSAWAIAKIDGPPAALARIQTAAAAETDPERKKRLEEAVRAAQSYIDNPNPAMFAD